MRRPKIILSIMGLCIALTPALSNADHSGQFNSCDLHIALNEQPALTGVYPTCHFQVSAFGTIVGQVQGNGLVGMRIDVPSFFGNAERAECGPTLLYCSTAEIQTTLSGTFPGPGTNTITCTYTGPFATTADMSCYIIEDSTP